MLLISGLKEGALLLTKVVPWLKTTMGYSVVAVDDDGVKTAPDTSISPSKKGMS